MIHAVSASAPAAGSGPPVTVLLVDDHEVFVASLAFVLGSQEGIEVVATASTGQEGLRQAQACDPQVVLLDHRLPDIAGIDLVPALHREVPGVAVVMLTASTGDAVLVSAIEAGAAGFVDKSSALSEVVAAVRGAAAGESLISPPLLARLLPRLRGGGSPPQPLLTDREHDVLRLLAQGLSNADIAASMVVSVHTVRNHVANISTKLGAHSKLEVLSIAMRQGLVSSDKDG